MNAREELVQEIMHHPWLDAHEGLYEGACPECPGRKIAGGYNSPSHAEHLADAILAAGYAKPRVVTTVEELDALPVGSAVIDRGGMALQKTQFDLSGTGWNAINGSRDIERIALERECFPATVLYSPEPGK